MRLALTILTTVDLFGFSDGITPAPAPTPKCANAGFGRGHDERRPRRRECITGATVQVIAGQGLGRSYPQTEPRDPYMGFGTVIQDLEPGVEMTLRASASGYGAQEKVVVPIRRDSPHAPVSSCAVTNRVTVEDRTRPVCV
jgi:hypothetical protein